MKPFKNKSFNNNEKAIRRGKVVPDGDVNLAWVKAPKLSPSKNMIVFDTSNLLVENSGSAETVSKLFYANHLGILEDENGNQIIEDEYPAITDEFSVEENYEISSENEFLNASILAYKHVSRYFHVDQDNLTSGDLPLTISRDSIVVEDEGGREYLDADGNPRYKVRLLKSDDYLETEDRDIGVYRVWIFIDVDDNESLYLKYNKVELTADGKYLKNQNINHKEILNPQPHFTYIPEETDVADFMSESSKIYSTKAFSTKEQILGVPRTSVDGYKVYAPRKAIPDPRVFQLFRWRVKVDFQERYVTDPSRSERFIRAGILTVDPKYPRPLSDLTTYSAGAPYNYLKPSSRFPYIFYNMEKAGYNPSSLRIINPIAEERGYTIVEDLDPSVLGADQNSAFSSQPGYTVPLKRVSGDQAKEYAGYWLVNLDTVSDEDLQKFDVLVLDQSTFPNDISPYLPKLMRFAENYGGSIYTTTNDTYTRKWLGPKVTLPVHPISGEYKHTGWSPNDTAGANSSFALGDTISPQDSNDEIFKGQTTYGGWDFDQSSFDSVSPNKFHPNFMWLKSKSYSQFFYETPESSATADGLNYWKTLFEATESTLQPGKIKPQVITKYPITLIKRFKSGGSIILDAQGAIAECSQLEDVMNIGPRAAQVPNYVNQISSARFEGSHKLAWNWVLSTLKNKPLDSTDETRYASTWSFKSKWKSSWVINGNVLKSVEKNANNFAFEPKDILLPNEFAWRRKLSAETVKQIIDKQIIEEKGADYFRYVNGSSRKYTIEVTNSSVKVPTTLSDNMYPHAWTEMYSPEFIIPPDFGPHVIKEKNEKGQYRTGQYLDISYPDETYNVRVNASYRDTSQSIATYSTTILARFKAQEILPSGSLYSHVALPRTWTEDGSNQILFDRFDKVSASKKWGSPMPNVILSQNEMKLGNTNAFPYAGITGNYRVGDSGEIVRYIQYALNRLNDIVAEMITKGRNGPVPIGGLYEEALTWALRYRRPTNTLRTDGVFDQDTGRAVAELKSIAGARYQDAIADSEFFAILGSQLLLWEVKGGGNFEYNRYNYLRYAAMPDKYMNLRSISDGSVQYNYLQTSDSRKQVDRISDIFLIQLPKLFALSSVSVTPYLLGDNSSMKIDFVDTIRTRIDTTRFTGDMLNKAYQWGDPPDYIVKDWIEVPVPSQPKPYVYRTYWNQGSVNGKTSNPAGDNFNYVALIQLAVLAGTLDGVYGPQTAAQVLNWKRTRAYKYGIEVNSDWGDISDVKSIQRLLGLAEDGVYGPAVFNAVRVWQEKFQGRMPIDGLWGPITQKQTDELFAFLASLTPPAPKTRWVQVDRLVRQITPRLPDPGRPYPKDLLRTYTGSSAYLKNLNITASNGQRVDIPIPWTDRALANTIIVGVSQDKPAGGEYGNVRSLGLSDITGYGTSYVGFNTIDGGNARIDYEGRIVRTISNIKSNKEISIGQLVPSYSGPGHLTNVEWGVDPVAALTPDTFPGFDPSTVGLYRIESSNPEVQAFITKNGYVRLYHQDVINENVEKYTAGAWLPSGNPGAPTLESRSIAEFQAGSVYCMDENGALFPGLEAGTINKADGVKILCDINRRPIGFPTIPNGIGANEAQRHYADFDIETSLSSPFVRIGFYDFNQREFIINEDGSSRISYIEYIRRGPQNVYIAVVSQSETITKNDYPEVEVDAPTVPFKYAMPVYGVTYRKGSQIGIQPLPKELGPTDIWSIPIKAGSFDRNFEVPEVSSKPLTGWIKSYQGKKIKAFYSIPEAEDIGWSNIFGRPVIDIKGEHPIVVSEDIIRLKQAPIFMISEPTPIPSLSDPVRPFIRIWTRNNVFSEWVEVKRTDILDYNTSDGTIYLRNKLNEVDSNLVKVDYSCLNRVYNLKEFNGKKINLNPYIGNAKDLIGVPVYVWIVPEFAKDEAGNIIQNSLNESTLRVSTDNSVLNQFSPNYDPLAFQLGVVYVTPSLDINELTVLDTRRRGGGAIDSLGEKAAYNLEPETEGYWDFGNGGGLSFQYGGFVIVRLPKMLKTIFPDEKDIINIIRKNISAGVEFKVEDLEGQSWNE